MRLARIALVLAAGLAPAYTQSERAIPATFEVASIKLSGPHSARGVQGGPGTNDPERFSFQSATLLDLIADAYHVEYRQVSSRVPLEQREFDFEAKVPPGATRQQFRVMLQNFLAERFHLKHHVERREFPGYELVVAKTGAKLATEARSTAGEGFPELPPNRPGMSSIHTRQDGFLLIRLRARQQSMPALADWLQPPDEGPVADKTGLAGKYDFTLEYAVEQPNVSLDKLPQASGIPDLFTALQQQLGLQLVRKKIPLDVVVVESIDKVPAGN